MSEVLTPDLCVIGAGSGGLSVAAAAAKFGVEVVLIEKGKMGGDCLNYGCVPSKSLIAASHRAHIMRFSQAFGIAPHEPEIDHEQVAKHIRDVIAAIEPNDSVERFTGLGVKVIQAEAKFVDKKTVSAGDYAIQARRFIIATGSSPFIPPIEGLDRVTYYTNENIFDNKSAIDRLIVIGGGPIGLELAQAFKRLGSDVAVIEAQKALGKDDPELTKLVLEKITSEGVNLLEGATVNSVEPYGSGVRVHVTQDGEELMVDGSHLLIATGRKPNVEGLDLEKAAIKYDTRGITVSKRLKTSNGRVFAIGDVIGAQQFTHVANYHAGIVIRNALFRLPVGVDEKVIPWVTFTDPEIAHVGLTEEQARAKKLKINVLRWPYSENDRAQAERATDGFIKVITAKSGKILGATIAGEQAGELINMWSLAISQGMKIGAMTGFISPYPTLSEISKRAAYNFYIPSLGNPNIRRIINFLAKLG